MYKKKEKGGSTLIKLLSTPSSVLSFISPSFLCLFSFPSSFFDVSTFSFFYSYWFVPSFPFSFLVLKKKKNPHFFPFPINWCLFPFPLTFDFLCLILRFLSIEISTSLIYFFLLLLPPPLLQFSCIDPLIHFSTLLCAVLSCVDSWGIVRSLPSTTRSSRGPSPAIPGSATTPLCGPSTPCCESKFN